MTISVFKKNLPQVLVKYDGKVYRCNVSGRKNKFATVKIDLPNKTFVSWEFAWATLVRSINTPFVLEG